MQNFINGSDLYVARVRIVLENDQETGIKRTAHYNKLGYRLFLKKSENTYMDILTEQTFPVLTDDLEEHRMFILDPKPFWNYAPSLRIKEWPEDVRKIAKYVSIQFNKYKDEKRWKEAKDELHRIHHGEDEELTF